MNLQDHIFSVTLTGRDSRLPSRPNRRHRNVFSGRRIGSLKLTGMSGFSSSLVLLLSVISPTAGWGWVPLKFQLINEQTLIITLLLFAPKNNPSIHVLIIRVKGHWVRGCGSGHTLLNLRLRLGSSVVCDDFKVLNYSKFSLENLQKRLHNKTFANFLRLMQHVRASRLLGCSCRVFTESVKPAYIPDALWGAMEVLGFLYLISSADRARVPSCLSVRPCGVIPISWASPPPPQLISANLCGRRFVPLIGGPQLQIIRGKNDISNAAPSSLV